MRLSRGDRLGPYEILSPLGAGGMGEVYRARDSRLGRDVAVKVLPEHLARDPDALARFQRESRAVAALSHPNIRVLHDVGQEGDVSYAAMELLEGRSLWTTLREEGPMKEGRAVGIALQVASGLSAAHEKGIVHRDLKPENVFLCDDGLVKILDFGLARTADAEGRDAAGATLTEPGLIVGTPAYMSPEQVRGVRVDNRSDIFSLGLLLWEMADGRPAFEGASPTETMHAILKDEPRGGEAFTPGLRRLLSHCLEKNPSGRFQTVRDVGFALEALSHATAPAVTARGTRGPRLGRRGWVLAAVSVAGIAGIGLLLGPARRAATGFLARHDAPPRFSRVTFRRGNIVSARFTADGQSVVHSAAWEDKPADVFVTRLGRPESRSLGLPNGMVRSVSPSSEIAAVVRRDDVYHPGGLGTLVRVPLEGGAARTVAEEIEDACWSPDGATLAVIRRLEEGFVLEYPEGKVLARSGARLFQVRVAPSGLAVAFLERTPDAARLHVRRTDGLELLSIPVGSDSVRIAWHPSGREIWLSNRRGAPPWGLHAVSLEGRWRALMPGVGLVLHDVAADGRALVETFFLRDGIALSARGGKEVDFSWLEDSAATALSDDGKTLLFGEVGDGGGPVGSAYVRRMEGAPVRLGDGVPCSLSPDGASVIVDVVSDRHELTILSTGAGQARPLKTGGVEPRGCAFFLPGGRDVVFNGRRGSGPVRAQRLAFDAGDVRPLGPEGSTIALGVFSPRGDRVILVDGSGQPFVLEIGSSQVRPLAGVAPHETVLQWSEGGELVVRRRDRTPARLDLVDVETGRRRPFKTLEPDDRAGIIAIEEVVVTRDLATYAYSFSRVLASSLHVVEGLPAP